TVTARTDPCRSVLAEVAIVRVGGAQSLQSTHGASAPIACAVRPATIPKSRPKRIFVCRGKPLREPRPEDCASRSVIAVRSGNSSSVRKPKGPSQEGPFTEAMERRALRSVQEQAEGLRQEHRHLAAR